MQGLGWGNANSISISESAKKTTSSLVSFFLFRVFNMQAVNC